MDTVQKIGTDKLIAVIRLDDLSHADSLCRALIDGGIRLIEFTLTNPHALDVMRTMYDILPEVASGEVLLGTGTVLTADDARRSIEAGARFCVSPVTEPEMIRYCVERNIPTMPGALTPTEMWIAHQAGSPLIKFYPAPAVGPDYMRTVLAPMPFLKMVPSGGITLDTIDGYLEAGAFAVGLTGALVNTSLIQKQRWDAIQETAAQFVAKVQRVGVGAD